LVSTADFVRLTKRERFLASIQQGLTEADAGLGVDDADVLATLDAHCKMTPIRTQTF
jgi:predicted transcriptional regulator